MRLLSTLAALTFSLAAFAQITTENVNFNHGGCTFGATLTKPSGSGPFTTLVLVPGSGQNDRNGTIQMSGGNVTCLYPGLLGQTLTMYKDLAEDLADSGYAVLHYDELMISCPSYSGSLTYENLFLPALSAIDYLKTRTDVDTNKIILMGHSEGAQLISYMSSIRNDVKATISIAGARTPFDSLLAYQLVHFARTCNGDTNQAKSQAQQILAYFNLIRSGNYPPTTPAFSGVAADEWETYIHKADSVAIIYQQNNLPTLMLGFGDDINVPLTELARFQQSLNGDFTFNAIQGLNHYMTTATDPRVSRTVADTIVYWLRHKTLTVENYNLEENQGISVYPNPFSDKLYLNVPESVTGNIEVEIRNLTGQLVWKEEYKNSVYQPQFLLAIPELKSGVYVLNCNLGDYTYSTKIYRK